jgi:Protein of unknown function (DUF835)
MTLDLLGFQLSEFAAAYSFATIASVSIIILTLRIPFRKNQHYLFLAFMVAVTFYFFDHFLAMLQPSAESFLSVVKWSEILTPAPFLLALVYHFALSLRGPGKILGWWRYSLVGAYAFAGAYMIATALDTSLFVGAIQDTPAGWAHAFGSLGPYLEISGIQWTSILTGLLIVIALVDSYRANSSPTFRTEVTYILLGVVVYSVVLSSSTVLKALVGGVLTPLFETGGTAFLLIGANVHGFYPATPVEEQISTGIVPSFGLTEGRSYLGLEQQSSFSAFAQMVKTGWNGLCISTRPPDEIRRKYGFESTPVRWLANSEQEDAIDPGDLVGIASSISSFMMSANRPVVLLDGLDYLVFANGFRPTMAAIARISQVNELKTGILLLSSPTGEAVMGPPAILEVFDDVPQIQVRVKAQTTVEVGEKLQVQVDLFNTGKRPAHIDRIEDLIPENFDAVQEPKGYKLKGAILILRGKKLEPFQLESLLIGVQARKAGDGSITPRVVYSDEKGTEYARSTEPILVKILPPQTIEFEGEQTQSVFSFLVKSFNEDYMLSKHPLDQSGWRTLSQIAEGAEVPKTNLYGRVSGRYGPPIYELLSRGLIEERVFSGHRGRGGEATKFRISYEKEPVRRYVDRMILKPA